jgi:hypothetical protein
VHVLNAPGFRVVAAPAAIDTARFVDDLDVDPELAWPMVFRFAPDEVFAICDRVEIEDPDAIVEREAGFVAVLIESDEIAMLEAHTEWPMRAEEATQQGAIAGVPVKVLRHHDGVVLLVARAHRHELLERLGIDPGSPAWRAPGEP